MKNFSGVCQAAGADKPLRAFFIWITNIVTCMFLVFQILIPEPVSSFRFSSRCKNRRNQRWLAQQESFSSDFGILYLFAIKHNTNQNIFIKFSRKRYPQPFAQTERNRSESASLHGQRDVRATSASMSVQCKTLWISVLRDSLCPF